MRSATAKFRIDFDYARAYIEDESHVEWIMEAFARITGYTMDELLPRTGF
jgi:hypothetical protein